MILVSTITDIYADLAHEERAKQMRAYMRNQFDFYGIPKPERAVVNKGLFKQFDQLSYPQKEKLVKALWKRPQRELHYFAMEAIARKPAAWLPEAELLFDEMLLTHCWWDTVDFIAVHCCGAYLQLHQEAVPRKVKQWTSHDSFWMHRTALLFQLKYKSKTNEKLLFSLCTKYAREQEFFIRKAIGWVLREYSKTNPAAVQDFIASQPLSPLSIKEGSKYL
jgi:3-methyladenine DNA glycosylase AlkD